MDVWSMIDADRIDTCFVIFNHRPLWTVSIQDIFTNTQAQQGDNVSIIQLSWLCLEGRCPFYDRGDARVWTSVISKFHIGSSCYIITRKGMASALDLFFSDRTVTGLVRPYLNGYKLRYDAYMRELAGLTFIATPPLFTVEAMDTTIGTGLSGVQRLQEQRASNNAHLKGAFKAFEASLSIGVARTAR